VRVLVQMGTEHSIERQSAVDVAHTSANAPGRAPRLPRKFSQIVGT
jgi:hypothetical protein